MTIAIANLHFTYQNSSKPVLDIPAWSVAAGERVFLHGPSGAGKSTLLNLLAGTLVAPNGGVEILGESLHQLSGRQRDRFRAQHIGYVFQQFNLIPHLSAMDNVLLAAWFARSASNRREVEVRAAELFSSLGIGETLFDLPASSLSIGQQQRVAIARALINRPPLLIADEPTSALDTDSRDAFMALLMRHVEADAITLIFVSHDSSLAANFARIEALHNINLARGVC